MAGDSSSLDGHDRALDSALRKALRPVVRLLIARSLRLPFIVELLKSLYVDVADREFPVAGKPQTDSRVNLLTGVHRKDVKRLRTERRGKFESPHQASLSTQLIARWTNEPRYLDANGKPLPLPRADRDGTEPTFDSLVRDLNTDIRPRVVLDEWQRLGIASIDDGGRVCLQTDAFIPAEGSEEMAYYFGRNLHDHAAAAVHNVLGGKPPRLERSVAYNNLTSASVDELAALARRRGMETLQELNSRALELQRRDASAADATLRMNFGVYFFTEPEADGDDVDEANR